MSIHALVADLEKAIGAAQVQFDYMTRLLYSTDASNYQIMPIGVTFPRHADDVVAIHEVANCHQTPLLPRGGGSSLAGQTVGQAIVMDFSRHMRRVRSINAEAQVVSVEPGLVLGQLNHQVKSLGLMYGPDPASAERATVGGCVGNNATGAHSILYGMTSDNIQRLEMVLASGEKVWLDANHPTLNAIRTLVGNLAQTHAEEIKARFPKTFRTVAGYALNKIDPQNINLNWLMAGSEGTLGTIVGAELKLVQQAKQRRLALVHFDTLRASLETTPRILETDPSAIELMDKFLMDKTRTNPDFAPLLTFVEGDPSAVLIVEYYGESDSELASKVDNLKKVLQRMGHTGHITDAITPQEQAKVWTVRKAGLGLLLSERGDAKPVAFIEDAAVPVEHLANYIQDVENIIHKHGTIYAIYAHASAGCLHVRPLIDLKTPRGHEQYYAIGSEVAEVVVKYGGTITGEHGKGLSRGEFSEKLFGETLTNAFREIKQAFDPNNLMNPGKIIDPPAMNDASLMRYSPSYEVIPLKTRFDWSADGGLSGAAEMCNGAGVCRKEGTGTMCPSFMATLDEAHVTRGRANALRQAMSGKIELDSPDVKGVFDLCLSCKACKSECPSSVDVARMKAEYLAAYHDIQGTPLTTRIFANIHRLNRLGSLLPQLANFMFRHPLSLLGASLVGLPTERPLPLLANQRFTKSASPTSSDHPDAVLVVDTFTEYNHPEVGLALLTIAQKLGVTVNVLRLPEQGCCGRPAISKGMLDQAKFMAEANVGRLSGLYGDVPYIFLEPSCQSAFTDDYLGLVSSELQAKAAQLAKRCLSAETWLVEQLGIYGDKLQWQDEPRQILLHGHCHQKALWGTSATKVLLNAIPNASVKEIDSGCCGVAGSFGYEHYDLSLKIANQRLLPAIEAEQNAIVAAPGTSCRAQIHDNGYPAWHPVEIIAKALK